MAKDWIRLPGDLEKFRGSLQGEIVSKLSAMRRWRRAEKVTTGVLTSGLLAIGSSLARVVEARDGQKHSHRSGVVGGGRGNCLISATTLGRLNPVATRGVDRDC